jgi:phosphoglycolate phosphatase
MGSRVHTLSLAPERPLPIRAILFDKDGTLIDFHQSWSPLYRELCVDLCDGDHARASAMLSSGGMDLATGRVRAGSVMAAGNTIDLVQAWYPGLSETERVAMIARIDRRFHENGILHSVPVPGLKQTLAALKAAGFHMGVATSDGTAAARAALAALAVADDLPHVFGYDSVREPKPAPDMVHAFARVLALPVAAIAVVGDNTHDLHMARAADAGAAIGVLTGTGSAADLSPLADVVLPSIVELPEWLATLQPVTA